MYPRKYNLSNLNGGIYFPEKQEVDNPWMRVHLDVADIMRFLKGFLLA